MDIFLGLCGSVRNGYESSGRGEGRWALSLARCLKDYGHRIVMAPDTEPCEWGSCVRPDNVLMLQPWEKAKLEPFDFDIAIFTSWQTGGPEAKYVHADKYVWGIMGWKGEIMNDSYFRDNEYVARWFKADLPEIPYPINFQDRCFLLAQPFGKALGGSKFSNKRVAWVAKEAFLSSTHPSLSESARRHLFGTVDACKECGAGLSIFSSNEFDPSIAPRIKEMGIMEKLSELKDVRMYGPLPYPEYHRELQRCSVTIPLAFAGSIQESIFSGLVPMMYKDSMFSNHPDIKGVCNEMTLNKVSRYQSEEGKKDVLSSAEIKNIVSILLSDKTQYDRFLDSLRPMVIENMDDNVVNQLNEIVTHKCKNESVRR